MPIEYFAPCSIGLEPVLRAEVEALGPRWCQELRAGVAFGGDRRLGYAANLWLRTAIYVQEQLIADAVRDDRDLYEFVKEVDWSHHMGVHQTLAVDASVRDSAITHSKYAALRVKDAIVDQFRERTGRRPSVDTKTPDLPLKIVVIRGKATLYRNLAGRSLHKRGWRPIQVKSPLNEALAAGLILLSGWDRESPLVDPMCGSGTFPIEAAQIAAERAPGLQRRFAFERWPDFDAELWAGLKREARDRARASLDFPIEGADRHRGALSLARMGAEAAGVADLVQWHAADARSFRPRVTPAQVVVNPPWGVRLGEGDDLRESWVALGEFLHAQCRGATAHVLSGQPDLPRLLGLKASRKTPVRNGSIDCRWLRYEIRAERAPRRAAAGPATE